MSKIELFEHNEFNIWLYLTIDGGRSIKFDKIMSICNRLSITIKSVPIVIGYLENEWWK